MLSNAKLKQYAKLLVEVGLNVQKGQTLVISCPVDCAYFARLCAEAGYEAGCKSVEMEWRDDALTRMKYLRADDAVFDVCPPWRSAFRIENARAGAAFLSIHAEDPSLLAGVEPGRIQRASRAAGEAMKEFHEGTMQNRFQWCISSIPVPSWAKTVFPELPEAEAVARLWERIFDAVRITDGGDAVAAWRSHIEQLTYYRTRLNELRLSALHYQNALGTDLTVELPEGHFWAAGQENTQGGVPFVANMPTEEVFTAPKRDGVNGRVVASMPLVLDGNIVRDFALTLEAGRIVRVEAGEGQTLLEQATRLDEGAAYLGEAALVPFDSPISDTKTLFYNTLFDENASCHLAFGSAYPCIEGGDAMSEEERRSHGLNTSMTHVDFMIGTRDLSITGLTADGREIPVFVQGNFAL